MLTKQSILESIEAYLISRYKKYHANAKSDWYKDLELNNFARLKFYIWAEKRFGVSLPSVQFTTLDNLADMILDALAKKELGQNQKQQNIIIHRFQQMFQNTK